MEESHNPTETGNFVDVPKRSLKPEDLQFLSVWIHDQRSIEELEAHVNAVHDDIRGRVHIFGCISAFLYLTPLAHHHPTYPSLIEKAQKDSSFKVLDLGCCFGQETRNFLLRGLSPHQVCASDLNDTYWEAGKDMFMDGTVAKDRGIDQVVTKFGDWALPNSHVLSSSDVVTGWEGHFNGVLCWAVLHVLSKEQVDNMLARICKALKPGGVLLGVTGGARVASEWFRTPDNTQQRFLHDATTLREAFERAGFTGTAAIQEVDLADYVPSGPLSSLRLREDNRTTYQFTVYK